MSYSKQTKDTPYCTHLWYVLQQTDQGYSLLHTPLVCLTANRPMIHLTAHTSGMSYSKQTKDTPYCTHLWDVLQQIDQGYTLLHTPQGCLTANRPMIHLTAHTSGMSYSKQTRNTPSCTHLWYVLQQTDQEYILLHTPLVCLTANRSGILLTAHTSGSQSINVHLRVMHLSAHKGKAPYLTP